jgi:hypothetical protein
MVGKSKEHDKCEGETKDKAKGKLSEVDMGMEF